ncbi:hypothetical protein MOUN0_J08086 [Monosporozyma unispora]|nr:hypothetical protein C6P44_002381 [Kazachstania unispora]
MGDSVNEDISEPNRGWFSSYWGGNNEQHPQERNDNSDNTLENDTNSEHWYQRLYHSMLRYPNQRRFSFKIDESTRYSQLDLEQINYLETEAIDMINSYSNSWCWFEDLSDISENGNTTNWTQRSGVVSVFGTGCGKCPLPLDKSPIEVYPGYHVYVKNSILLPASSPKDYLHPLPMRTKIANTVREHYNYPNEKHLYLKRHLVHPKEIKQLSKKDIIHKRHLIITAVGWLPDKYEKLSLGEQRTAQYLSKKVAQSIKELNKTIDNEIGKEVDHEILSLSFECPLHTKDMDTVLEQCTSLLKHWEDIFYNIDSIYFVGVYHSVPLLIELCHNIIFQHARYGINLNTTALGMLTLDSCLEGYRFWDHSVDRSTYKEEEDNNNNNKNTAFSSANDNENNDSTTTTNDTNNSNGKNVDINGNSKNPIITDQEYLKLEQSKEKQLYYGLNNNEIDLLSKIKNYYNLESDESKHIQKRLDWLLYNCETFRLNLVSTLYDNFMTLTQKLAIDYSHPKITRNIWCDGRFLDIDLQRPESQHVPNFNIKTPDFEFELTIPKERKFEIILLNHLILTQNLGHEEFIPILKLISPYFISRSFNDNTLATTIKKQRANQLKTWLQEMDQHWNNTSDTTTTAHESSETMLPPGVSDVHEFLRYISYQNIKNPDLLQVYGQIYDDDSVYRNFIEISTMTRNPTHRKHMKLLNRISTGPNDTVNSNDSILDTQNQYDLVWKFHEWLCNFIHLRNLPIQDPISNLEVSVRLEPQAEKHLHRSKPVIKDSHIKFERNSEESQRRVKQIWKSYQTWAPQTRGLENLKKILSILGTFPNAQGLIQEVQD